MLVLTQETTSFHWISRKQLNCFSATLAGFRNPDQDTLAD